MKEALFSGKIEPQDCVVSHFLLIHNANEQISERKTGRAREREARKHTHPHTMQ